MIDEVKVNGVIHKINDTEARKEIEKKADKSDINTIKEKIPTQATNNNQLADKDFVNSSLNSITAFYITKNADGDQFNSKAELDSATEFYSGGEVRVPTRNDYCIVLEDETKENSTTRYIYQNGQWEFQYVVNETPLTSEQIKAINSGITPELVAKLQGIDLTNVVRDADYVHTDNNYTNQEKTKLAGLNNYDDTEIRQEIIELNNSKQNIIDNSHKLSSDLVDDTNKTNKFVTNAEKTIWNNKADISDIPDVSQFITKDVNNLTHYTLKTNTGSLIDLEINQTTYVVTLSLKDQDGNVISTDTIDLPLENVVVSGSYDSTNEKIVLTLQSGDTVDIPVGALVAGLQTEITSSNKLASDLVDDSNNGHKFVTTSEKQTWNSKYEKPSGGIPKTDLESAVQISLGKADTALQSHQDISGKEDKTNKTTIIDTSNPSNDKYPSESAIVSYVNDIIGNINTILDDINGEVI